MGMQIRSGRITIHRVGNGPSDKSKNVTFNGNPSEDMTVMMKGYACPQDQAPRQVSLEAKILADNVVEVTATADWAGSVDRDIDIDFAVIAYVR